MEFTRGIIDSVIFELFSGTAKYKRSYNYKGLVENWEDERPVPGEQEMVDTWNEILEKKSLKHPDYYRLQDKTWVLDSSKKQELKQAVKDVYDNETKSIIKTSIENMDLNITSETTEAEFETLIFNFKQTQAVANTGKKIELDSETMQGLIDIYDSLTIA